MCGTGRLISHREILRGHSARSWDGSQEGGGLVAALEVLVVRDRIGNDAGARLERGAVGSDEHRANRDRGVEVAAEVDIADDSRVRTTLDGFEFVDDLHRANLRRAADRA